MVYINGVGYYTYIQGTSKIQSLSNANTTVSKGLYNATTLETVDTDLIEANIVTGATIFGIVGSG